MTSRKVMPTFNASAMVVSRPLERDAANMEIGNDSTLAGCLGFPRHAISGRDDRNGSGADDRESSRFPSSQHGMLDSKARVRPISGPNIRLVPSN